MEHEIKLLVLLLLASSNMVPAYYHCGGIKATCVENALMLVQSEVKLLYRQCTEILIIIIRCKRNLITTISF